MVASKCAQSKKALRTPCAAEAHIDIPRAAEAHIGAAETHIGAELCLPLL